MKRKFVFLYLLFFVLFLGSILTLSCTYDASLFKQSEGEEALCVDGTVFCDGACVSLTTKLNCGSCGNACTFDRLCVELSKGEEQGFRCLCPEGLTDCGSDLLCLPLDGGTENSNDKRCGDCNTICSKPESCEKSKKEEGQYACTCLVGKTPLSGQELSDAYLISPEHCGGCGVNCANQDNKHKVDSCKNGRCVCGETDWPCQDDAYCEGGKCFCSDLGVVCRSDEKCVGGVCACVQDSACKDRHEGKTCKGGQCVCRDDGKACEGGRVCFDGRCACVPGEDHCKEDQRCDEELRVCVCDADSACVGERVNRCVGGVCVCGDTDGPCEGDKSDHCTDAGVCVCGDTGGPCEGDRICKDGRCACTLSTDCSGGESCDLDAGVCVCGETGGPCPDNETCVNGQCSCGGAKSCAVGSTCTEAGYCNCSDSWRCNDAEVCKSVWGIGDICVCQGNQLQKACGIGAKCESWKFGWSNWQPRCVASDVMACYPGEILESGDDRLYCACSNTGIYPYACAPGMICGSNGCVCDADSACVGERVNRCVEAVCVCGDTGGPCDGVKSDRCTDAGLCVCGETGASCPENETCVNGQCSCGGAKSCAVGSTCTEAGYCDCSNDGRCNDAEECKSVWDIGDICVCQGNQLQKACGIGAKCESWKIGRSNWQPRCVASDVMACYPGETLRSGDDRLYCACSYTGTYPYACAPAKTCYRDGCK